MPPPFPFPLGQVYSSPVGMGMQTGDLVDLPAPAQVGRPLWVNWQAGHLPPDLDIALLLCDLGWPQTKRTDMTVFVFLEQLPCPPQLFPGEPQTWFGPITQHYHPHPPSPNQILADLPVSEPLLPDWFGQTFPMCPLQLPPPGSVLDLITVGPNGYLANLLHYPQPHLEQQFRFPPLWPC